MQNMIRIRHFGALSAFVTAMVLWVPAVGNPNPADLRLLSVLAWKVRRVQRIMC